MTTFGETVYCQTTVRITLSLMHFLSQHLGSLQRWWRVETGLGLCPRQPLLTSQAPCVSCGMLNPYITLQLRIKLVVILSLYMSL